MIGYLRESARRIAKKLSVDQIEHSGPPSTLRVSAVAVDFTGTAKQGREEGHNRITLGDLTKKLAERNGYKAVIKPASLAQVLITHVDQAGQSDLAMMFQVARQYGAMFKPVDGSWVVLSYDLAGADEPPIVLRPGDVTSWRAHFIPRNQWKSVKAYWHDWDAGKRIPVVIGAGEPQKLIDQVFVDDATARANASAMFSQMRRESRLLSLTLPGMPELASQRILRLRGFRDNVDQDWLILEVNHTINKRGYTCSVQAEGI
ncbi:MAG: hypothetical protein RQ757_06910 [Pseudomonadales bacterium]|nr:hypothetical protein [Pseudomonadales bacterium]